jgi:YVTN family beta-propeller protein
MYVSNEDDAELTFFDMAAKKKAGGVKVGAEPEGVLAHPNGKVVYVTSEVAHIVHVVDTGTKKMIANVVVGNRPRRLALTPDQKELWVTNEIGGSVSIIDTAANKVIGEVKFEPKGFRPDEITPVGITMTRDGKVAYVGLGRANHVAVVSVPDRKVTGYTLVGKRAWNVTLTRDEKTLYVVNGLSDDMSVVDTATLKVSRSVPIARVPHTAVVDD